MRKKCIIIFLLIGIFFLTGCDYDEKSLQALSYHDVPEEVTMDFELPRGVYGEIIYSSSDEEVLFFEDVRFAKVIQQQEDQEIIITAKVNLATKRFNIKVLKIGSTPTPIEQARIAFSILTFPELIDEPFLFTTGIDEIEFRYEHFHPYRLEYDPYRIVEKLDGSLWLVPNLLLVSKSGSIIVRAFMKIDGLDALLMEKTITVEFGKKADITNYDLVINEVEIGTKLGDRRFQVQDDFTLPVNSVTVPEATIRWESSDTTTIQIAENGMDATVIFPSSGIHEVNLTAYITIDEITHPLTIRVEIPSN